jgi:hypothetical protein
MAAAEQKKSYQVVKQFRGVNTKANRTAIDENEFAWLENAMPIVYANLKITPYSCNTPVAFANVASGLYSANINNNDYALAFQEDGSCEYVDIISNTKANLAIAGTFSNFGINITQWKSERVLIADKNKGIFNWDGTNLVAIGGVGSIGIVNSGSGYTSTPAVIISAPNQTGGIQAVKELYNMSQKRLYESTYIHFKDKYLSKMLNKFLNNDVVFILTLNGVDVKP